MFFSNYSFLISYCFQKLVAWHQTRSLCFAFNTTNPIKAAPKSEPVMLCWGGWYRRACQTTVLLHGSFLSRSGEKNQQPHSETINHNAHNNFWWNKPSPATGTVAYPESLSTRLHFSNLPRNPRRQQESRNRWVKSIAGSRRLLESDKTNQRLNFFGKKLPCARELTANRKCVNQPRR